MKKIFISVLAALVTSGVIAQTSSGSMMVGGSIYFTSGSQQGGSVNDFSSVAFSPGFGYFIRDNLAVGTVLTLGSARSGTGAGKTVNTTFGFGPFVRYYKFTSNENFGFFAQAGLAVASGKTDPPAGAVTKSNSIAFSLSPGAAYFFNTHWALELSMTGLVISSSDPDTSNNNDKVTRVDFGLSSFSPNLGFRYHF